MKKWGLAPFFHREEWSAIAHRGLELGGRETLGFGLFPFVRSSAPAD